MTEIWPSLMTILNIFLGLVTSKLPKKHKWRQCPTFKSSLMRTTVYMILHYWHCIHPFLLTYFFPYFAPAWIPWKKCLLLVSFKWMNLLIFENDKLLFQEVHLQKFMETCEQLHQEVQIDFDLNLKLVNWLCLYFPFYDYYLSNNMTTTLCFCFPLSSLTKKIKGP